MTPLVLTFLWNAAWQAPLLLLTAMLAAFLLRRLGPETEYRVWVSALLLQLALPACAGIPLQLRWPGTHVASAGSVTLLPGSVSAHAGLVIAPWLAVCVLTGYGAVTGFLLIRFVSGVWVALHLPRRAVPLESVAWDSTPGAARLTVAESRDIRTPVTVGIRRPCILLPEGLARLLSAGQMRALLAHESAHVARRDFATNLLLQALALPISWHPCTRIVLARLAASREMVCDRLAVARLTNPPRPDGSARYARCLLEMASLLADGRHTALAQGITISDRNTLERRIMALTQRSSHPSVLRRLTLVAASALLAGCACTAAVALHTTLTPGDPVKVSGGVMAGHIRTKVAPVYPQAAKDARVQGTVLLHAVIAKDGTVQDLTVLSGPPELTASALDAVRQWVYEPFLLNGEPTEVETTITINYALAP